MSPSLHASVCPSFCPLPLAIKASNCHLQAWFMLSKPLICLPGLNSALKASNQLSRPQICSPDLKSAFQASNQTSKPQICPLGLKPAHKSDFQAQNLPSGPQILLQLPLRPDTFPLRTFGNYPLCPTGHRLFGAADLLSLYYFTWSLEAGRWIRLTMYDSWMNSWFWGSGPKGDKVL